MNRISNFNDFSSNFKKSTQSYRDNLNEKLEKILQSTNEISPIADREEVIKNESVELDIEKSHEINENQTKESNQLYTQPIPPIAEPSQPKYVEPVQPIGYKIFRDKVETFQCRVYVEGSSLQNTKVRLILDSNEWNLVFYGSVDSDGLCKIPLKKITVLSEKCTGEIRLEVISDDTLFIPWKEKFTVMQSKKVSVEIISSNETDSYRPGITVSDIQ